LRTGALRILAIVDSPPVADLFFKVFGPSDDRLFVASTLSEGLALAASEAPDLAFVDVSLGHNAGLALVHHVRAVAPRAAVYALARVEALDVGAQAVALGGAGLIMLPASGDELLSAAAEVRTRLAAETERRHLEQRALLAQRATEFAGHIAALVECVDRRDAAKKLAPIFVEMTGAETALVYVPATEGSKALVQLSAVGAMRSAPSFTDEMGLVTFAEQNDCDVVPLAVRQLAEGHVLLAGLPAHFAAADRALLELLAGQAATTLALLGERERVARGAIKDSTTSAYTFAYFVDIAGREIDKARRYARRFALATIALDENAEAQSNDLAEVILSAVRDTDILARVDEREFYLLMPETGGIGAQSCRRRVLQAAASRAGQPGSWGVPAELSIGVATYPHDGTDLSRLLRAAKRRAELSRHSVVRALDGNLPLPDLADELLRLPAGVVSEADFERPRSIVLSLRQGIDVAIAAVSDAVRGGSALVAVGHHPELGLSSSVRAHLGHEREGLSLHTLNLTGVRGCRNLQVLTVIAEHGAYFLVGRSRAGNLHAVHGADPIMVDLVTLRSGQAAGVRLLD
jgi:GGDEF domain-containing protein/ActR/RegA family two-component response regulator